MIFNEMRQISGPDLILFDAFVRILVAKEKILKINPGFKTAGQIKVQ